MLGQKSSGTVLVAAPDVKEGPDSFRAENESASVAVRFHSIIHAVFTEHQLDGQGFFQLLGYVNQTWVVLVEK